MLVDASGIGKNFVTAQIDINGDAVRSSSYPLSSYSLMSVRILRTMLRNSLSSSFLLVPIAQVVQTKTFALHHSLRPQVLVIAS